MQGVYSTWLPTLPSEWLVWLATSALRFQVYRAQGLHAPVRFLHLVGTAAFFGAILLLDLRLLAVRGHDLLLDALARMVLPVTHWAFGVTLVTGVVLFLYDPIQVGSHGWFLPKLALLGLAMTNAALFSIPRGHGLRAIPAGTLTRHARIAGALSLLLWTGVIAAATASHEERPIVQGRGTTRPVIRDDPAGR